MLRANNLKAENPGGENGLLYSLAVGLIDHAYQEIFSPFATSPQTPIATKLVELCYSKEIAQKSWLSETAKSNIRKQTEEKILAHLLRYNIHFYYSNVVLLDYVIEALRHHALSLQEQAKKKEIQENKNINEQVIPRQIANKFKATPECVKVLAEDLGVDVKVYEDAALSTGLEQNLVALIAPKKQDQSAEQKEAKKVEPKKQVSIHRVTSSFFKDKCVTIVNLYPKYKGVIDISSDITKFEKYARGTAITLVEIKELFGSYDTFFGIRNNRDVSRKIMRRITEQYTTKDVLDYIFQEPPNSVLLKITDASLFSDLKKLWQSDSFNRTGDFARRIDYLCYRAYGKSFAEHANPAPVNRATL